MNDKMEVLFKNLKDFESDFEENDDDRDRARSTNDIKLKSRAEDMYGERDEDMYGNRNGFEYYCHNIKSQSSRDTLNSLYSDPRESLINRQKILNNGESSGNNINYRSGTVGITPPPSSSNSLLIQTLENESSPPDTKGYSSRIDETRKRNGIININTINLLEQELYNLTPPHSPSYDTPVTAIIPPLPLPSRILTNQLDYNTISNLNGRNSWNSGPFQRSNSRDDSFTSWLDRPVRDSLRSISSARKQSISTTSIGTATGRNNSMENPSIASDFKDISPFGNIENGARSSDESYMPNTSNRVDYESIPKTELLIRAAGGALKAGSKKLQNLLNLNGRDCQISASNSYSYQERRSIDSTVPSLFDSSRRGSNASTSSNTSHIQIFKRGSSNLKTDHSAPFSTTFIRKSSMSPILEEESESGTLKRALSWPRRKPVPSTILPPSVADATLLNGYEPSEIVDSAIFSIYLLKKNRRGQFQKRLIRCDGVLLVCMSSLSAYIRKGTISEYDLLESPHDAIRIDLYNAIRDYYPPGSSISSLARNLISVGKHGTAPEPNSKIYYVPKWIIPVSKLTKFQCKQTVTGTPAAKLFTIHSSLSDTHTFQAYSLWEVGVFKEIIVSMVNELPKSSTPLYNQNHLSDIMSDSIQVSVTQQMRMNQYLDQQYIWKRVMGDLVNQEENVGPKVTTIQLDTTGANVFRGLVIQPPSRIPSESNQSLENESDGEFIGRVKKNDEYRMGRVFNASPFSKDISSKIDEIDQEIEKYQNKR